MEQLEHWLALAPLHVLQVGSQVSQLVPTWIYPNTGHDVRQYPPVELPSK